MKKYGLFFIAALLTSLGYAQPRSVILMISDGGGKNHIRATNLYLHGKPDSLQAFEKFPVAVFMSTYSAQGHGYDGIKAKQDKTYVLTKYTDSASSGTALATGVKTYDRGIGVDTDSLPLVNVTQKAERAGKSTGVVTTVPVSHATPASMIAHNIHRDNYEQIAREMFTMTSVDVIIGAGHPEFNDNNQPDSAFDYKYVGGKTMWERLKAGKLSNIDGLWHFVDRKSAFDSLAFGLAKAPPRLAGIARTRTTLQMRRQGADSLDAPFADSLNRDVPDLAVMSQAALNVLNQNSRGFFLMIEGGAVDWASHDNQSARMIEEQVDFFRAVDSVISWIEKNGGWERHLLIVTADHETGALEILKNQGKEAVVRNMRWNSKNHTNQLVPLYAKGNGAEPLRALATGKDPQWGPYLDNAQIGQWLTRWASLSD